MSYNMIYRGQNLCREQKPFSCDASITGENKFHKLYYQNKEDLIKNNSNKNSSKQTQ